MAKTNDRESRGYGRAWIKLTALAKRTYPAVCHLCGQPIDLTIKAPNRAAWSLDHLDPIASTGTHTPPLTRVRPAHLGCNVRRRHVEARTPRRRSRAW